MSDKKKKSLKDELSNLLVKPDTKKASKPLGMSKQVLNVEASLKQSEYLRIAQKRIQELEHEIQKVRQENEELSTAGIVVQRKYDELLSKSEKLNSEIQHNKEIYQDERKVLDDILQQRNKEKVQNENKIEELQSRVQEKLNSVRIREKELENRIELLKNESEVVLNSKDEMILTLKRNIEHLEHEIKNHKFRNKEISKDLEEHKGQILRTVKALRLSLSMLEGEASVSINLKKTGS